MLRPGEGRRLLGVDAARGVALLGMMSVHVLPAQDPDGSTSTAYLVASGRAAAAFALLAGVGLALASGGRTPPRGRWWAALGAGVLVRAMAIGLVGLGLGYADSGLAVILAYYAVLFVLAIPLLGLGPRPLAFLAVAVAFVVPAVSHLLRQDMPPPDRSNPVLGDLADPVALLGELSLSGYYPALAWTTYLCAGLAAGRLRLTSPRVAAWLLAGGAALAVAATAVSGWLLGPLGGREELVASLSPGGALTGPTLDRALERPLYGTTPSTTWWWLAVDAPHSGTPFDLLHTTGTALALLGAMLLLARWVTVLVRPLAWAGSMTLTLYTLHALALSAELGPTDPQRLYLVHVTVALVLAAAWRSWRDRGPLEEVVSWLSRRTTRLIAGGQPAWLSR